MIGSYSSRLVAGITQWVASIDWSSLCVTVKVLYLYIGGDVEQIEESHGATLSMSKPSSLCCRSRLMQPIQKCVPSWPSSFPYGSIMNVYVRWKMNKPAITRLNDPCSSIRIFSRNYIWWDYSVRSKSHHFLRKTWFVIDESERYSAVALTCRQGGHLRFPLHQNSCSVQNVPMLKCFESWSTTTVCNFIIQCRRHPGDRW